MVLIFMGPATNGPFSLCCVALLYYDALSGLCFNGFKAAEYLIHQQIRVQDNFK
jgi:hypothetical protein